MNGSILLAGAPLLAVWLWWASRRRSPALLSSIDTSQVAALNRAQIELVQQLAQAQPRLGCGDWPLPTDARQRRLFLARLQAQLAADQPQRLAAMRQARAWGHAAALPLLRRGLRDVHPAVCLEAARALERFRGRTSLAEASVSAAVQRLPRNVARTR